MPVPQTFAELFPQYVAEAKKARDADMSERHRSDKFLDFVRRSFEIDGTSFVLEQTIYLANVQKKGYIDALFGDLVFEFKRKVKDTTQAQDQLRGYLLGLGDGHRYVGLITDGLKFEVYVLEGDQLRGTDTFDLETIDAETAFTRLDAYLFSQSNKPPTSVDIVSRFGGSSQTFYRAYRTLEDLLSRVSHVPMLGVWREQWRRLLSKVYGSDVGSDELFLRHTYLCQFARLLAYAALNGIPDSDETVERIVNGDAFQGWGVSNIGEDDFFSWVLMPEIRDDAVRMLRRVAEGLIVYDLSRIDQDLLKQLYQNLVDPQTRHDLGEFYTPDWLAELTLEDIDYKHPQSLLDPACGSGSFLFSAIKRLAAQGVTGWKLVEFATDNIMGMDVHPLAVTIARINTLLALAEHMQASRGESGLMALPVYMADALITPLANQKEDALVVPVDEGYDECFYIPVEAAAEPGALTETIDQMYEFARHGQQPNVIAFGRWVAARFQTPPGEKTAQYWLGNLKLLAKLIHEGRNGIWSYILKNLSRPLVLAERKFDVVTGNPPWLSYRYIKSRAYQKEVKTLYQYYGLIESDDVKQFSNMDLSTLFFAHARDQYLKPNGTLAFVMPRAVITGAKQHRPFQAQGVTRVIDLRYVSPLFNVETCVYITEQDNVKHDGIPSVQYIGTLKAHELSLEDALPTLTRQDRTIEFVDSDVRSTYYYERFKAGARLAPRNLYFVKPQGLSSSPAVITDPDADREAKVPWKGNVLRGSIDDDYLYATLLSKHLLPFGYERLHLVALPVYLGDDSKLHLVENDTGFTDKGQFRSLDWFKAAAHTWNSLKKTTTNMSLVERLNYQNLLLGQTVHGAIKVLYNASGTHISAFVVDTTQVKSFTVHGRSTQGFIADDKTYVCETQSPNEAHYLCALLNAPVVDKAIKAYQTRGIYKGERDIHRTPFEACAIPPFAANNADHMALAQLSQEAHEVIELLKVGGGLSGSVYKIRVQAREAAAEQIAAIDVIARRVLGIG